MKYNVKVKLKSKIESVELVSENELVIKTNAAPVDGAANNKIVEMLADYFKVPKSRVRILHGKTSKTKVVEIL